MHLLLRMTEKENKEFDKQSEWQADARMGEVEQLTEPGKIEIPDLKQVILQAITQPPKMKDGVQETAITGCIRQRIFEIIQPKRQSPQSIIRMVTGTALHRYTQKRINNPDPEIYDVEVPVNYNGYVFGSIDLYHKKLKIAIEIKTKVISNLKWEIKPYQSQVEQLRDLMAMKDVSKGILALILVGGNETIKQFEYYMSKEERKDQLKKIEDKARSFLTARSQKNPSLAKHVFFDKNLNWLCHRTDRNTPEELWCPYYWDCIGLIAKDREANIDKNFHVNDTNDNSIWSNADT
jgi:hypothetical protein